MKTLILAVSLSLLSSFALAKAPVWKVSDGENHLYLGGTIHVLSESDYPLPAAFDSAYSDSQVLVFETDIMAIKETKTAMKLMAAMMLRGGAKLKDQLSPDTYAQLQAFSEERLFPLQNFQTFTPAGLSLVMMTLELQRLGMVEGAGVDQHFYQRAIDNEKNVNHFETIDEQVAFVNKFNDLDSDKIVESMMLDIVDLEQEMDKLLDAWRNGDADALDHTSSVELRDKFPDLYQFLLVDRNNKWMTDIPAMLDSEEVEFILVGALHLVGKDGLVEQLRSSGFQIEQLN